MCLGPRFIVQQWKRIGAIGVSILGSRLSSPARGGCEESKRVLNIATSWVLTLKKCWCRIVINMESSPITAPDMLQTHLRCSTLKIHRGPSEGSNTKGDFWPWCHFLRFQKFGLVAKRPPSPAYVFVGFPKQDSHLRWLKRFLSF